MEQIVGPAVRTVISFVTQIPLDNLLKGSDLISLELSSVKPVAFQDYGNSDLPLFGYLLSCTYDF